MVELLAWGEQFFDSQQSVGGGASVAAHARQAAKSRLAKAVELPTFDEPPPLGTEWVVEVFQELNLSRSFGDFGPNPLTYSDVAGWLALQSMEALDPLELRLLKILDAAFLKSYARSRRAQPPRK